MFQIARNAILTGAIVCVCIFFWKTEIDTRGHGRSGDLGKIKNHAPLSLSYDGAMGVRFTVRQYPTAGYFGLIVHDLKFANALTDNVQIKSIKLRYAILSWKHTIDSFALPTVATSTPKGNAESIIVHQGPTNIEVDNWKNIKEAIGEENVLLPGRVLKGSAAFVFDAAHIKDLEEIKSFKIVVRDYSRIVSKERFAMQPEWIEEAERSVVYVN